MIRETFFDTASSAGYAGDRLIVIGCLPFGATYFNQTVVMLAMPCIFLFSFSIVNCFRALNKIRANSKHDWDEQYFKEHGLGDVLEDGLVDGNEIRAVVAGLLAKHTPDTKVTKMECRVRGLL